MWTFHMLLLWTTKTHCKSNVSNTSSTSKQLCEVGDVPKSNSEDAYYTYLTEDSIGETYSLSKVTEGGIVTSLAAILLENASENL